MDAGMQANDKKRAPPPLQKFRPPTTERPASILRSDALDGDVRRRIVRDIMGDAMPARGDCPPGPRQTPERSFPANLRDQVSSGNADLLGAMAQRLKTLEAQQHAYRMELKEKTERLMRAEADYNVEKGRREEAEAMVLELCDDKEELEKTVGDMKKFLADYGLKWIGDKEVKKNEKKDRPSQSRENGPKCKGGKPRASSSATSEPFELYAGYFTNELSVRSPSSAPHTSLMDSPTAGNDPLEGRKASGGASNASPSLPVSMDILKRNAKILSDHVGCQGVVTNGKQGGIREREVVRVVIYKDGICVNGGPFRPYGWPLCDAVLNDLAEGFYPYEFKQRFPDGFPIEIIDKTSVECMANSDGKKDSDNVKKLHGLHERGGYMPVSREEFLKRLPATRITPSGRMVAVRGAIANFVGPTASSSSPPLPMADTLRHVSQAERQVLGEKKTSETQDGVANTSPRRINGLIAVLVRFPTGEKVTLHLSAENTIADLRRELQAAMPSFKTAYDLRLSFPATTFKDDGKTLRELGLVSSCTLMIQPRKESKPT